MDLEDWIEFFVVVWPTMRTEQFLFYLTLYSTRREVKLRFMKLLAMIFENIMIGVR